MQYLLHRVMLQQAPPPPPSRTSSFPSKPLYAHTCKEAVHSRHNKLVEAPSTIGS